MTREEYLLGHIKKALIKDMENFLVSRDRREEWINCEESLNSVVWCNWFEFLPDDLMVEDIEGMIRVLKEG